MGAWAGRQSDTTSHQDATGCCQATPHCQDTSGHSNWYQDVGDAGDTKTMLLTSGHNACTSDTGFIFADVRVIASAFFLYFF